jgi:succinate dehydrogenase / fumarate reductase cytochrome b subunit
MRWSGVIFGAFLLFHLADLTWGIQPMATETWEQGEVYANFVATFSRAPVTFFYVLAMVLLGLHLYHGAWSMFQSLGINHPRFNAARRIFAIGLAVVVTVGNAIMPLAVLFGWVG